MNPISGARRQRDENNNNNVSVPSSQQSNINNSQQQQQPYATSPLPGNGFLPATLITTEATNLIGKLRSSSAAYKKVIDRIEEEVMYGVMKGMDERTIMMKCRQVMEENPIVEMDL